MKPLILICLLVALSTHAADDNNNYRSIEYEKFNQMLTLFETQVRSPYLYYRSYLSIKDSSIDPDSIKLWLSENGKKIQDISISLDEESGEYLVTLPRFSQERADDIELYINQPKEAVGLNITFGINTPKASEVFYNDLMIVLDDINELASEMGGAISWFIPDMDQLILVFDAPATITLTADNFSEVHQTDEEHSIILEHSRKISKLNPKVIFSRLPVMMVPED